MGEYAHLSCVLRESDNSTPEEETCVKNISLKKLETNKSFFPLYLKIWLRGEIPSSSHDVLITEQEKKSRKEISV